MMASACTLDTLEYGKIDPGIFPQTKDDADALVVSAAYHPFNSWYLFNSAWGYQALSDFTCDYVGLSWQGAYIGFDMTGAGGYPITDEDRTPVYIYSKYLSGMELALERIKDVPMDEEDRNVLNAQLHCAMALLAYMEYDLYGPVSLPTVESLQKPLENIITPRASEKEMQDYIETNALEAVKYLPYKWDAGMYGRFTKGCAQMVLLKLYMMTKRWADAEAVGAEIVKPEYGYELMPDYNDMLTEASSSELRLFMYETGDRVPFSEALKEAGKIKTAAIITGPEGGFEPCEAEAAKDLGMKICSMGKRILRCETAPVVAVTALMLASGNLE